MKIILFVLSLNTLVFALEIKTDVATNYINFTNFKDDVILDAANEIIYKNKDFEITSKLHLLYSAQYNEKRYLSFKELFISKEYENYAFKLGKIIKFLGELEGYNVADVFNQKDYLYDPFDKSAKSGAYAFLLTKYIEENSLELGIKFYEEDKKFPKLSSPYALPFSYNEELLLSAKRYTPTIHLNYSFTTDELVESETKFIIQHGYDNKRYFTNTTPTTLTQYAYRVNKFILTSNILYEDTIFKLESSYTNVVDEKKVSDYAQLSFGIENNLYDIKGFDITFYNEYYKYFYKNKSLLKNIDISEVYNNDIFSALRLNFNDTKSSELRGGVLYDLDNSESVLKFDIKSRIKDGLVLKAQLLKIVAKKDSVLTPVGNHTRFRFWLTYIF